jgi:hypothetical protein
MRVERWYWLAAFCFLSFCVHLAMTRIGPAYVLPKANEKPQEMEVALQPISEPVKKPEPKPLPIPKPRVQLTPKPQPRPTPKVVVGKRREAPVKPTPQPVVVARNTEPLVVPKQPLPIHLTPIVTASGGLERVDTEKPVALGAPTAAKTPTVSLPHLAVARRESNAGGGAPAPSTIPDGKGGASGPEAPPEETLYYGGGKGGKQLPKEAPAIGGGGGASILSVNNPLAKDVIAEDKPGAGPGTGGNAGTGTGGGIGFARSKGIGTNLSGRLPIASLSKAIGAGNGNSSGNGTGTRPPGGGHGLGSDLPGAGGEGLGYGRGKGVGIGSGNGASVGEGTGGSAFAGRGSPSFGDIGGLLAGDPGGGGGRNGGIGGRGAGASNVGSFGSKEQIPFALKGDIYFLDPGTQRLPTDFKRLKSVGSIYAPSLNIPTRNFTQGFPGVTDHFEWFAIDYNGEFRVRFPARYRFRLTSDDGSKLFIDAKLVIDNDGTHSTRMREGSVSLSPGKHTIEVQYFQGPRAELALVLDVKAEAE